MLVKLTTDKTVSETAALLQAAVQANHFGVMQDPQPQRNHGKERRGCPCPLG